MHLRITTPMRTFDFTVNSESSGFAIGSGQGDDIRVEDDLAMEAGQCLIERSGDGWNFKDRSAAGARHNGERKFSGGLAQGDVLEIATTRLEVISLSGAASVKVEALASTGLEEEFRNLLRAASDHEKAYAYKNAEQREAAYRDLARRAAVGTAERISQVYMPLLREGIVTFGDVEEAILGEIEDPLEDLSADELAVIDAIVREFKSHHGIDLRGDAFAMSRVAFDAEFIFEDLKDEGEAEIDLPYLAATKEGPRHCCAKVALEGRRIVFKEWIEHEPAPFNFKPRPLDPNEKLLTAVLAQFKSATGIDLSKDDAAMTRLRDAVKTACIELKAAPTTEINLPFITAERIEPTHLNMRVTREMLGAAAAALRNPPEQKSAPQRKTQSKAENIVMWIITAVITALVVLAMYLLD